MNIKNFNDSIKMRKNDKKKNFGRSRKARKG